MVICFAIICSCQKQDSTAEQELAQRKMELEAREKALDERMNALDERVNSLYGKVNASAEKEKAMENARIIPTGPASQDARPSTGKS